MAQTEWQAGAWGCCMEEQVRTSVLSDNLIDGRCHLSFQRGHIALINAKRAVRLARLHCPCPV